MKKRMKISGFRYGVARFEFTAKVRLLSFVSVFVSMMAFFLANPTAQLTAATQRVNWDNHCQLEKCQ